MSFNPKKSRSSAIGAVSGPFIRDTGLVIEKFVEAVKDLFTHAYTEKSLYGEIHEMSDAELFANLTEYLEDVKFSVYDSLAKNLDKISLKFLQVCDRNEGFEKYLKVLKEKWRVSSGHQSVHRHDDRHIRSAKEFVNKLSHEDGAQTRSRSKNKRSIVPQVHLSEFDLASDDRRNGKHLNEAYTKTGDMPITKRATTRDAMPGHLIVSTPRKLLLSRFEDAEERGRVTVEVAQESRVQTAVESEESEAARLADCSHAGVQELYQGSRGSAYWA